MTKIGAAAKKAPAKAAATKAPAAQPATEVPAAIAAPVVHAEEQKVEAVAAPKPVQVTKQAAPVPQAKPAEVAPIQTTINTTAAPVQAARQVIDTQQTSAGADAGAGKLIYLNGSGAEPVVADAAAGGETDAVQSKMDGLTQ